MNVPGDNVRARRKAANLTLRGLADRCKPALDHSTISRLEAGKGYTQDTLERVAVALRCTVQDFFLPVELIGWNQLDDSNRAMITTILNNAIAANTR